MSDDSGSFAGILPPKADPGQPLAGRGRREDRVDERAETDFRVFFTDGQYLEGEGTALDLSKSGCRVHCPCDLPEGAVIELWLFMPNYDWPLRVERALVRWKGEEEFGLQFLSLRPSQRERLRQFIRLCAFPLDKSRPSQ